MQIFKQKEFSVIDGKDLIMTLPSSNVVPNGIMNLGFDDDVTIETHVVDKDCKSSYPSNTQAANISMATTKTELSKIPDEFDELEFKHMIIGMMGGRANSVSTGCKIHNLPTMSELLE